ncbi:hypothetical protein MMC13_001261 [Lambiella insularis]|nr:hypothetical protein [Lambiella insularis]
MASTQPLALVTNQICQPDEINSWLPSQSDVMISNEQPFQAKESNVLNVENSDSFWLFNDIESNFWSGGLDFNFADDPLGAAHLSGSIDSYTANDITQLEPQGAIFGHQPAQNALDMAQAYFFQNSRPSTHQPEKTRQRWLSSPPRFQIYDEEVVRIFVNIAKYHLARTIPILADFTVTEDTRKELCLAFAAVGGLFCNIPGRLKVVNAMYNDSRRMLLGQTYRANFFSVEDKMSVVKTFILLEIYGFCSGDKRSYEFAEAFHTTKLLAVEDYMQTVKIQDTCRNGADEEHRFVTGQDRPFRTPSLTAFWFFSALVESLHVLECYRVILLLRPPSSSLWFDLRIAEQNESPETRRDRDAYIGDMFTPCTRIEGWTRHRNVVILTTIATTAWPVLVRGVSHTGRRTAWKPEFIELALSKWATTQPDSTDWSTLLLYHLVNISLHANIGLIQRFAHTESGAGRGSSKIVAYLQKWQRSRHFAIAKWHAQSIVERVKNAMTLGHKRSPDTPGHVPPGTGRHFILPEPPHLPYCLYFAALVLWCGSVVSPEDRLSGLVLIERCTQLLSSMKLCVAELLGVILSELKDGSSIMRPNLVSAAAKSPQMNVD